MASCRELEEVMKSWARFVMMVVASSVVGCGVQTVDEIESDAALTDEGEVASVGQALDVPCDPTMGWCNGNMGWANGNMGWANGNMGWANGNMGWANGINGFNGVWTDLETDGYADAFSEAYGASFTNGWNYAGLPSFKWAEAQTCAHPLSQTGTKLAQSCNYMAGIVCKADPYCCSTAWDSACVREATTWAGKKGTYVGCFADTLPRALPEYLGRGMTVEQCTFEARGRGFTYAGLQSGGECYAGNSTGNAPVQETECNMLCTADATETCGGNWRNSIWQVPASHPVTKTGIALSTSESACAAAVIAQDSYCGNGMYGSWDATCVQEAAQLCTEHYVTRPRFEDGRAMVDACVETKIQGYPACPFAGSGPAGKECCRRALVLNGFYKKNTTATMGTQVQWSPTVVKNTALGTSRTIRATLVPDPEVINYHGDIALGQELHLWQAAGPDGSIYPDCSGSSGPRPCNAVGANALYEQVPNQHPITGAITNVSVSYRAFLVTTMSALLTTDGHYMIDIRASGNTQALPWHLDIQGLEAIWEYTWSSGTVTGKPHCLWPDAPQRTSQDPYFVSGLYNCQSFEFNDTVATQIKTYWGSPE
jgi:WSC domain